MPDTTAASGSGPARKTSGAPAPVNLDRVGEELADEAHIWGVYERVAKQEDDDRVQSWNRGFDNLALFATLFSAVTTSFLLEARNDMVPDYAELSFLVLNATNYGTRFVHQPFVIPPAARTINALWTASLILSLLAALISVMGKEWMTMYAARPDCNSRQWAEIRTYRLRCIERWYVPQIVASAQPLLLHTSFVLFLAGLVLFISPEPFTHHLTLGLCVFSAFVYFVTALSAIIFASSPFKSPASHALRTALSVFFSYLQHRQKCTMLPKLWGAICTILMRRGSDDCESGASRVAGSYPSRTRRSPVAIVSAVVNAMNAHLQSIPTSLRAVEWSRMRLWLVAIATSICRLPVRDLFVSSTWTDIATESRPNMVADALSWLSSASQAPDVFRAIVFALGDLDIGPQVGEHTSNELRGRLRAEIGRTWQRVDFLTLSRYVLADQNTSGVPVLNYDQFTGCFDPSSDSAIRCEDGLAAVIRVDPLFIVPHDLARYSPNQVAQPRMPEFLRRYIRPTGKYRTDVVILLSHQYRTHLWKDNPSYLKGLDSHLDPGLDAALREEYAAEVAVHYDGTTGTIEFLTFLIWRGFINQVTKPAAVQLIMDLVERTPIRERRCLAYVFGRREHCGPDWKDKHWSQTSLDRLSQCLETTCRQPLQPFSGCTQSDDLRFGLALANTAAMLLAPRRNRLGEELQWIEVLSRHLCQSPPPKIPDDDGTPDIIYVILENAALLTIGGTLDDFDYDNEVFGWSTGILAAILRDLRRRLCDSETVRDGEHLFALLTRTDAKGVAGETFTWDLGEWLCTQAQEIVKKCSSGPSLMQGVHDALCEIYPLCEGNPRIRIHWDRIDYSGRPGDPFSNPFRDLDLNLGEFFAGAENPGTH